MMMLIFTGAESLTVQNRPCYNSLLTTTDQCPRGTGAFPSSQVAVFKKELSCILQADLRASHPANKQDILA